MRKKKSKTPIRRTAKALFLQYVLLLPSFRKYIIWFKTIKHRPKNEEVEKVVIIEE